LWNWQTIDSCFVSEQWHVHSNVGFAFSVIGVFLIVCAIEAARRSARDYDRMLITQRKIMLDSKLPVDSWALHPTRKEQLVRGVFYGVQFSAAYMLMLIAMSYNGFVLFAIFLGGTVGYVLFGGDTLQFGVTSEASVEGRNGPCC
ncbi:hypothetical protein BDV93DRAFT_456086, partial [Ceratobasidium sp. AG-I]